MAESTLQNAKINKADEFYTDLDLDNPDYNLLHNPFQFRGQMPLGFRQLEVDWWPATRLYSIDYANPESARKLNPKTPLRVTISRAGKKLVNKLTGEEYMDNPGLAIYRIEDRGGTRVPNDQLRLRLQTISQSQGYWLDTGILLGS